MELKVYCAYDEMVEISKVRPNPKNPNTHPENQIEMLAKIIEAQGWRAPITVSKLSGLVVRGHGRLEAAEYLGLDEVPVDYQEYESEEMEYADLLADNKISELAEIDKDMLASIFSEIDFDDIELTGYSKDEIKELNSILNKSIKEDSIDDAPEPPENPKSKQGDIYQLGKHKLMCGDSTDAECIKNLLGGVETDIVFTDPPYGISIVNDKGKVGAENIAKNNTYMPVKGDETTDIAKEFYNTCVSLGMKDFILFGGNYFLDFLPFSDGWIVWDKRGDMTSNNFADGEMAWCSFHTPVRIYKQIWNGMIREGEHEKRIHPTQKPVRMLSEILQDFTDECDVILDCFGGSGSILIACEETNRICYMMEYEPHYVDAIIKRWENITGEKARKIGEAK